MRLIDCRACAEKKAPLFRSLPATPEEPAEIVRRTDGRVILPGLVCDHCNKPLSIGESAVAWTAYRVDRPIRDWEHEYLACVTSETV